MIYIPSLLSKNLFPFYSKSCHNAFDYLFPTIAPCYPCPCYLPFSSQGLYLPFYPLHKHLTAKCYPSIRILKWIIHVYIFKNKPPISPPGFPHILIKLSQYKFSIDRKSTRLNSSHG